MDLCRAVWLCVKVSQAACKGKRPKHGIQLEDLPVGKLAPHLSVAVFSVFDN